MSKEKPLDEKHLGRQPIFSAGYGYGQADGWFDDPEKFIAAVRKRVLDFAQAIRDGKYAAANWSLTIETRRGTAPKQPDYANLAEAQKRYEDIARRYLPDMTLPHYGSTDPHSMRQLAEEREEAARKLRLLTEAEQLQVQHSQTAGR